MFRARTALLCFRITMIHGVVVAVAGMSSILPLYAQSVRSAEHLMATASNPREGAIAASKVAWEVGRQVKSLMRRTDLPAELLNDGRKIQYAATAIAVKSKAILAALARSADKGSARNLADLRDDCLELVRALEDFEKALNNLSVPPFEGQQQISPFFQKGKDPDFSFGRQ